MTRNEEPRPSPELQRELYEARNYHIGLHVEYSQLKNAYEKTVQLSEKEWKTVEERGLCEPVNKVISKFWNNVDFITTAFFDIMEILDGKESMDSSLLAIWRAQLVNTQGKVDESTHASDFVALQSSNEKTAAVPSYLEYLNSQLTELKGRIKWVEFNLMKYKFAAFHGLELKDTIAKILKHGSKRYKFPFLSPSKQAGKLEREVEWYRKKLTFFKEDIQRIKVEHQDVAERFLSPEDRKKLPSLASSLESALRGSPSNYRSSWIESSRHFNLSAGPSTQSSSSTTVETVSAPDSTNAETNSVLNGQLIVSSIVTHVPQPSQDSYQSTSPGIESVKKSLYSRGSCCPKCPEECHSLSRGRSQDQRSQDMAEIKTTCPRFKTCRIPRHTEKNACGEETLQYSESKENCILSLNSGSKTSSCDTDLNPFQETDWSARSMKPEPSTNPFDDDDDNCSDGVSIDRTIIPDKRNKPKQSVGNASQRTTSQSSTYQSVEEVPAFSDTRARPENSANDAQTLPASRTVFTDGDHPSEGAETRYPVVHFAYPTSSEFSMMSQLPEKTQKNVIRRISSLMHAKKK